MALGHVAERGGQQCEARFQLRGDLLGGHHAQPGRRQLQPQRHALDAAADALHRLRVGAERKVRVLLAGALGEELHRAVAVERRVRVVVREGEALQRQHPFLTDIQPLARGHQELYVRGGLQDVGEEFVACQQVFEVVHDQQDLFAPQMVGDLEAEVAGAGEGELERAGDG